MVQLPAGTLTFLLTDIEDSTALWDRHPEVMRVALLRHDEVLRRAVAERGGIAFKHTGDGMWAVFEQAPAAVAAAVAAQEELAADRWHGLDMHVRMALLTGTAEPTDSDYVGPDLHRCSRVLGLARGGQVLVTDTTADVLAGVLAPELVLVDAGHHHIRGIASLQHVYEVVGRGAPASVIAREPAGEGSTFRTSFIGRRSLLAQVRELLLTGRLVTLVGTGGCGKTRLAFEAARREAPHFDDGVVTVELAELGTGTSLVRALAGAVGLLAGGGAAPPLLDDVVAELRRGRRLLVLDNCEHLREACVELVDALLEGCPQLVVLTTSRQPLALDDEQLLVVPPLELPTTAAATVEEVGASEAVQLLVERAAAVAPKFRLEPSNAVAVGRLCRELDGIPLALELAAIRLRHLSAAVLVERLSDRLTLLVGRRRAGTRHQTLQTMVDWSYDLLDEGERVLLRRLSCFVGGFTLRAAEEACSDELLARQGIVHRLTGLLDKSLVVDDPHTERYRLLETVRRYAAERLVEAGEGAAQAERHRRFFVAAVMSVSPEAAQFERAVMDALEADHENLQRALQRSMEDDRSDDVVRLASRMAGLWYHRGYCGQSAWWRSEVLAHPDAAGSEVGAAALVAGAGAAFALGDFTAMVRQAELAVALADAPAGGGVGTGIVSTAFVLLALAHMGSSPARAEALLDDAAGRAAAHPWPAGVAQAMLFRGLLQLRQGDRPGAIASFAEAAAAAGPDDETSTAVSATASLSIAAHLDGDVDLAVRSAHEALASLVVSPEPSAELASHIAAALAAAAARDTVASLRHLRRAVEAVARRRITGGGRDCLVALAAAACIATDHVRADRLLRAAAGPSDRTYRCGHSGSLQRHYRSIVDAHIPDGHGARTAGPQLSPRQALDLALEELSLASATVPTARGAPVVG